MPKKDECVVLDRVSFCLQPPNGWIIFDRGGMIDELFCLESNLVEFNVDIDKEYVTVTFDRGEDTVEWFKDVCWIVLKKHLKRRLFKN